MLLLAVGCFKPDYGEGRPCATGGECPGDLVCQQPEAICVESEREGPPPRTGQTVILPESADFGSVVVGTSSATVEFQLVATGETDPVEVVVDGDFTVDFDECSGLELIEGQVCKVGVRFEPTVAGQASGELLGVVGRAPIAGAGLAPGALVLSPATVDFGDVETGSSSGEVLLDLTNMGGETLTNLAIDLGNSTAFAVSSNACGDIAAAETCQIGVTFAPSVGDTGANVASLLATADSVAGPVAAATSLGGFGELATYTVTVSVSSDFPNERVVAPSIGIDCDNDGMPVCSADVLTGTSVTFNRILTFSDDFAWLGACQGAGSSGNCTITIDSQTAVSGAFISLL